MTIYYTSYHDGLDTNPGTLAEPFLTIQHGIDALAAGDTLYVRGGVYNEAISISGGTSGNPKTVAGYGTERPVIVGMFTLPADEAHGLVEISGDYVVFRQFDIRHSGGRGVLVDHGSGSSITLDSLIVDTPFSSGIEVLDIDGVTITNCWVSYSCLQGPYPEYPNYGRAILAMLCTNVTITGNTVHSTWGEGICVSRCVTAAVNDNTVWDTKSNGIYCNRSQHVNVLRNILYHTGNRSLLGTDLFPGSGIVIMDEGTDASPLSHAVTIADNLVYNRGLGIAYNGSGNAASGLIDSLIVHNTVISTLVDLTDTIMGISVRNGAHSNSRILNNIILVPNLWIVVWEGPTYSGITWSHNVWSKTPQAECQGTHDVIADPKLLLSGSVAAGQLARGYFVPRSDSPVIAAGDAVAEVPYDYDGRAWGTPPDCGAFGCYPVARPKMRR